MRLVLFLMCILYNLFLSAQEPNYVVIDKSKGLPSNSVYNLFQDSKGFIWVSTEEGLSRYDGYQFKMYSNPRQTSKAGSTISEDRFGRIWYENFDGYLYYVENDSLKPLAGQNIPAGYLAYGITENSLFVIQEKGLDIFDLQSLKRKQTFPFDTKQLSFSILSGNTFYIEADSLLAITDTGLQGKYVLPVSSSNNYNSGVLTPVSNNGIWLYGKYSGPKSCYRIRPSGDYDTFLIPQEGFIHTASFNEGYTWFCTSSGTFAYDESGQPLENGKIFFPEKSISCVLKDRENNYWFSTTNEGLLLVADFSARKYFSDSQPTRISISGNSLLFGTQNNEIWNAQLPEMNAENIFKGRSNHSIDFLEPGDSFSPVLFTSDSFGIWRSDKKPERKIESVKDCEVIAPGIYATAITGMAGLLFAENSPDSYWKHLNWGSIPEHNGIADQNSRILVIGVRVRAVAWDSIREIIYYATNKGLFAVNRAGPTEIKNAGETVYFSSVIFAAGKLFGLTTQGELLRMDAEQHFIRLNEMYGQGPEKIKGIKRFGNFLFMYSSDEISYIDLLNDDPKPKQIHAYTSDIYDLAVWENKIFLSTPSGILAVLFEPQQEINNRPRFVLNYLMANNTALDFSQNNFLAYQQNNILIGYSILSFKTGSAYPLYYQINNNDWELCPPDARTLKLASLAPGDYTIRFRLGEASEGRAASAMIHFSIDKAWWYKWWAIGMYAGIFVLGLFLVYKRQIGIQERKNKLITEKIELEKNLNNSILTSIKSQMNPHFFYNALNTIQSFIYSNDKQNAGTYLSKFSKLTRMVLEMSEKESISLQEEITACRLYLELEQARFGEEFHFSIEVKSGTDPDHTRLPSMIIQPYIENAVKHGLLHKKGEKKLTIIFERIQQSLVVTVDDNGIGRQRSAELNSLRKDRHQSFSSEANQKRLELLNKERKNPLGVKYTDKQDANGQASGTTVIINIPI